MKEKMLELKNPNILACCLHVSDNYWKDKFRKLAYENIDINEYYNIDGEYIPKMPPNILTISIINHYHKKGEYSPKEINEMEVDVNTYEKWTSIKSKNVKDKLLMDYIKDKEENYVIWDGQRVSEVNLIKNVISGIVKIKNVVIKQNNDSRINVHNPIKISSLEYVDITDKETNNNCKKVDIDDLFSKYVRKINTNLTTVHKS